MGNPGGTEKGSVPPKRKKENINAEQIPADSTDQLDSVQIKSKVFIYSCSRNAKTLQKKCLGQSLHA